MDLDNLVFANAGASGVRQVSGGSGGPESASNSEFRDLIWNWLHFGDAATRCSSHYLVTEHSNLRSVGCGRSLEPGDWSYGR